MLLINQLKVECLDEPTPCSCQSALMSVSFSLSLGVWKLGVRGVARVTGNDFLLVFFE